MRDLRHGVPPDGRSSSRLAAALKHEADAGNMRKMPQRQWPRSQMQPLRDSMLAGLASIKECAKRAKIRTRSARNPETSTMRTEQAAPVRLAGLPPARLAGRDRRPRRVARPDGDARARDAAAEAQSEGRGARAARARRRRPHARVAQARWRRRSRPSNTSRRPTALTIAQPPQRPFRLEIETVVDPSANTQLMGLYRSGATYCTQCEAEGFRRITYFPDRPDVMAVYTTRIEADNADAPVLLANGNLVDVRRRCQARHAPLRGLARSVPEAVLSVRAGRRQARLRRGPLPHHVGPRGRRCASTSSPARRTAAATRWTALKRAMRWDEEAFGREYDLDIFMIVAVSDFNMGAMENKGLNVFNDKYVLASARDRDRHRLCARSRRSSRTNISTTGPATASPAATGSSSA